MLKNLKSLFVVEEPESKSSPKKTASAKPTPEQEAAAPPHAGVPAAPRPAAAPAGAERAGRAEPKFTEHLLNAMEAANLDGFDYLEFKRALKGLEKMPMDEKTRYQSAYAMAQSMNVQPAHLIQTANHYLTTLANEEKKFAGAATQQREQQVGEREREIQQLSAHLEETKARIEQLRAEVAQKGKLLTAKQEELSTAAAKIAETQRDFHASYELLAGQITADVERMQEYLK